MNTHPYNTKLSSCCEGTNDNHVLLVADVEYGIISINTRWELEAAIRYIGMVLAGTRKSIQHPRSFQYQCLDILLSGFPLYLCDCQAPIQQTLDIKSIFNAEFECRETRNALYNIGKRACDEWFLNRKKIKKLLAENKRAKNDWQLYFHNSIDTNNNTRKVQHA